MIHRLLCGPCREKTCLYVHSSIAIILMGKRELIALFGLSSWCLVMVERLFLTVPRGCLQFVIVVFPDHTHFFRGFRQSEFQTSLLSNRDYLEIWNFTCSKFTYDTCQKANNKGADQTAWMGRLVCPCVVRKPPKTGFLASRPIHYSVCI